MRCWLHQLQCTGGTAAALPSFLSPHPPGLRTQQPLLQHVAQRVQRGAQQHQPVAQQRVGGSSAAAAAAAAAVCGDQHEQAGDADAGARVVRAAVCRAQQRRGQHDGHGDGEAVQQGDAGEGGEAERQHQARVGLDIKPCKKHVGPPAAAPSPSAGAHMDGRVNGTQQQVVEAALQRRRADTLRQWWRRAGWRCNCCRVQVALLLESCGALQGTWTQCKPPQCSTCRRALGRHSPGPPGACCRWL